MNDENGDYFGFIYNGEDYYYIKNILNEIEAISDKNENIVVRYTYDAWGNVNEISGSKANTLGKLNPIRYRGYYYDSETGFYYLKSRYYSPEMCRFINADSVISGTGESIHGYNLFSYCFNNPVNLSDEDGNWPSLIRFFAKVVSTVNRIINRINYKKINKEIKKSYTKDEAKKEVDKILSKYNKNSKITFNKSSISINDSYTVKRYDRQKICKIITRTDELDIARTAGNMSSEWLFHNIAYNLNIKQDSAKDVDIEYIRDSRPLVYIPTKVLEIFGWE